MVKTKRNYIVAILIVAVLTLSLFVSAVAILTNHNVVIDNNVPMPSSMTNIEIKDDNGKVDAPITSGGTRITTVAELKAFLQGSDTYGYLANNITGFQWDKIANDRQRTSTIEFGAGRVLDGNGYTVTVGLDSTCTDAYPMITTASAVYLDWVGCVKGESGSTSYASSLFIAVNQGTIKNLNLDVNIAKSEIIQWVPTGTRNNNGSSDREQNSKPLFFGFMTGVNFGYINNSTVNFLPESKQFNLQNGNSSTTQRYAKEEKNDLEFGSFTGVNAGEISYVTANFNNKIDLFSQSSSKSSIGTNSGNASARAIFGGLVGRMQSDPRATHNKVNITQALLTNSIISGNGEALVHSSFNGSGGVAFNHVGAAVGANAPWPGTVIDPAKGKGTGIIDGIISNFTGSMPRWDGDWEQYGTTSGSAPGETNRALIDCGKISNVMFADAYDGHIDNCACVGSEHIATRANGIKTLYGDGNLTMSFSKTDTSNATLIFEITPKLGDVGMVDDNVIFAITKKDRAVKDGNNITVGSLVNLFNYNSESYYSQFSDTINQTSKHAILEIVEPRAAADTNSYILELEFGREVKAMYETSTIGHYISRDEKLGRNISTFSYDGLEKGVAKVVSLQDGEGEDTFEENVRSRQFKSKYRSENQEIEQAIDYTMDLIYPGVYTDIYLQSTVSAKQAYLDTMLRIVAPLEKDVNGNIVTKEFKITPAQIVAQNVVNNVSIGGEGADKDDIDTNKLSANTYAYFDFDFSVFTLSQSGARQELKKTSSGSGDTQITTYPYDRIEYSDDGYVFKTALTYQQYEDGEKFLVNSSTHPINGRNYYFRAVKEVRDANGILKLVTTVTLDSKNYNVKIDGEAPVINAKIFSGENAGMDFMNWGGRNAWKKSAFTLEFNINEATVENLTFFKKEKGTLDSSGTELTLIDKKIIQDFTDDKVYIYYSFDKYGNRSKDYEVASKIDTIVPEFTISGVLKDFSTGGELNVDGSIVGDKTIIIGEVVANRTLNLTIDFTQLGASGATSYYKINNSDWIKISGGVISMDKVVDPSYYNNDGSVNKNIYDTIVIKTISGAGLETVSQVEYKVQVNKGIVLVDKDTVTTVDGFFITKGIRREHVTKTYTSNTALSKGLIDILNNAINDELLAQHGVTRDADKRIYVEGRYASANVGDEIPIILKVIDPLDVYTINSSMMELKGYIAPALINVTVNEARREYGRPNPKFTYSVTGLLGSDTVELSNFISAPENVNLETPVNREGINLLVPKKGYLTGNYRIGNVYTNNAKLYIDPQQLTEVTYDDSYLDFAYNGGEHFFSGTYKLPNGTTADLNVEYFDKHGNKLVGGAIEIGEYKAVFSIADTNYTLDPVRATVFYEVHKGFVNIDVPEDQLNLKFNGEERKINPILSNGSVPIITYFNDSNTLIHDGVNGSYPITSGTYTIIVEYNNDKDIESKVGKYYNNTIELTMTINKVAMAESGMVWKNVDKRFDGQLSQVIVKNIPVGTQIPEGLTAGEEEGSYILLERSDVGEDSKRFAFRNPNIIEQELEARIKISKASFDDYGVKFDSTTVDFDNNPHTIKIENLPEGIDVDIKTVTGTTEGIELNKNHALSKTDVGIYIVNVQITNDNFVTKSLQSILTIKKAKVAPAKTEPVRVKYDGETHFSIITGIPSDVNMTSKTSVEIIYTDSSSSTKFYATPMNSERTIWRTPGKVNSGSHAFRAIIVNANYENLTVDGMLTIEKATYKDFGTVGKDINVVYDGNERVLSLENLPEGTIFTDALGNPISSEIRATDAGYYSLDVYLSNPNMAEIGNHYKASLTISTKENPKTYTLGGATVDYDPNNVVEIVFDMNQLDPEFTVEFNQLEGMSVNGNVLTFVSAGEYNVVGYVVNKNYTPSKVTAKVIVNKIIAPYAGEVMINDQTVVFSGSPQSPKVEGLDESFGAVVRTTYTGGIIIGGSPSSVGEYKANITITHKNYIDINKEIKFIITPAIIQDLGFRIDSVSYIYDGNAHSVQIVDSRGVPISGYIAKLTYGDLPYGELPINAGSYKVSGVLSRPNYQDFELTTEGTLDIRKAQSPELTAKDISAKFNGKAQKVNISRVDGVAIGDYTVQIMKNGVELSDGIIDVGEYSCVVIVNQQNYTTVSLTVNVKITPKAVAIKYENVETPIVDNVFVLKGIYKDSDGKDQEVIFEFPEGFNGAAGKYTLNVKISDPNYVPTDETASIEFEIKGSNVGAIAGGSAGGVAAVGIGVGLFFVLKKKKISL